MILDMEDFTLDMIIAQAKAAQLKKEADAEKLPALFDKTLNALVAACEKLEAITAERDQLASELEEVKALFVDAIGDGFYDGCFACVKDNKDNPWHVDELTEDDILRMSEQYESKHRYAKSIADIRATAGRDGFIAGILLVNPTAKGRESLNDEANKYADSIRQAAKDGAA